MRGRVIRAVARAGSQRLGRPSCVRHYTTFGDLERRRHTTTEPASRVWPPRPGRSLAFSGHKPQAAASNTRCISSARRALMPFSA